MKILAIDTTASPVSAALITEECLLGEFFLNTRTTHSQTLIPVVEALLRTTDTKPEDIDLFAVNAGPGSFTGVRIGVSSVKGLAMPLEKPCAAVSTLAAMAYGMPYRSGIVCAVMDARCSQVYNALFDLADGEIHRLTEDRALAIEELAEELQQYRDRDVYLVGDGAALCYDAFSAKLPNVLLTPLQIRFQRAYGTARAALNLARHQHLCTPDTLMPIYLRLPQAERERKARLQTEQETGMK